MTARDVHIIDEMVGTLTKTFRTAAPAEQLKYAAVVADLLNAKAQIALSYTPTGHPPHTQPGGGGRIFGH